MTSTEKIKVVLIGETMTVKTSLIKRLIENKFEEESASTLVATTVTKTFTYEEQQLTLDIWDTVGQEKFRSLNKVFYKSAIIIILVYNITERYTFDQMVDYWYNEVKTRCIKNPIIAIVGNKSDLYSKEQVKEKEAKNFAQSIGALSKLTSCLNNSNVKELFEELGGIYLGLYSIKKLNGEEDDVSDEQRKEDARKRREQLLIESGGVVLNPEQKKEDKKGCC